MLNIFTTKKGTAFVYNAKYWMGEKAEGFSRMMCTHTYKYAWRKKKHMSLWNIETRLCIRDAFGDESNSSSKQRNHESCYTFTYFVVLPDLPSSGRDDVRGPRTTEARDFRLHEVVHDHFGGPRRVVVHVLWDGGGTASVLWCHGKVEN